MSTFLGPNVTRTGLVASYDFLNKKSYSQNYHPSPTDIYSWTANNGSSMGLSRDATLTSPVGTTPLKMSVAGIDSYTRTYNNAIWNLAPAKSGETWTVSCYVKSNDDASMGIMIFESDATGTYYALANFTFPTTTTWQRISFSHTFTQASATSIQTRLNSAVTINNITGSFTGTASSTDELLYSYTPPFNSTTSTTYTFAPSDAATTSVDAVTLYIKVNGVTKFTHTLPIGITASSTFTDAVIVAPGDTLEFYSDSGATSLALLTGVSIAQRVTLWVDGYQVERSSTASTFTSVYRPDTILDLSSSSTIGTPAGGFVYDGGSLIFDGSTNYISLTIPSISTVATIEMWIKLASGFGSRMLCGWPTYDIYTENNNIGFNTYNADVYGVPSAIVTSLGLVGTWAHYVFEMHTDVSYINNRIYINGVQQQLSQILATEDATKRTFSGGTFTLGGGSANAYLMVMECAVCNVYNRTLTLQEVTQNFNGLRTRFAI